MTPYSRSSNAFYGAERWERLTSNNLSTGNLPTLQRSTLRELRQAGRQLNATMDHRPWTVDFSLALGLKTAVNAEYARLQMDKLLELDRNLFLELNSSFHTPGMDQVMMFLTGTMAWLPLYVFLVYLLTRMFRQDVWMVLIAIALTVLVADQVTSAFMKPFFERLRPTHEPGLRDMVHIVDGYRGGRYGFASSHAANTFGIATLMWLVLLPYRRWLTLLFLWPLIVGYTRIYLGVHYPSDILVGYLVGFLAAVLSFMVWKLLRNYVEQREAL